MSPQLAEWAGAVLGVLGAILVASNTRASPLGFPVYLVSNLCLVAFGVLNGHWGVVVMNTLFMATSIFGIWRWSGRGINRKEEKQ